MTDKHCPSCTCFCVETSAPPVGEHVWSAQFECSHCKAIHVVSCSQPYFKVTEFECLRCRALTDTNRPMQPVETSPRLAICKTCTQEFDLAAGHNCPGLSSPSNGNGDAKTT